MSLESIEFGVKSGDWGDIAIRRCVWVEKFYCAQNKQSLLGVNIDPFLDLGEYGPGHQIGHVLLGAIDFDWSAEAVLDLGRKFMCDIFWVVESLPNNHFVHSSELHRIGVGLIVA